MCLFRGPTFFTPVYTVEGVILVGLGDATKKTSDHHVESLSMKESLAFPPLLRQDVKSNRNPLRGMFTYFR